MSAASVPDWRAGPIETWDRLAPRFPLHYYHHGMALEPLHGATPEPILAALSLALKPGGQLVLVEVVADLQLVPADPVVAAWARLDHRSADLPSELAITKVLGRLGFDVRIVEDITHRHMQERGGRDGPRLSEAMAGARPTLRQLAWWSARRNCGWRDAACCGTAGCAWCAGTRSAWRD